METTLPEDVVAKIELIHAMDPRLDYDTIIERMAAFKGWHTVPREYEAVTALVRHSKIRQFPFHWTPRSDSWTTRSARTGTTFWT